MTKKSETIEGKHESMPVCILTQTDRIKVVGHVTKGELDDAEEAMVEVVRFAEHLDKCRTEPARLEQLINNVVQHSIGHGFEVGLIASYAMFKISSKKCNCGCYESVIMIEEFVTTVGLINFSDYFKTEWLKLQPTTYYFGSEKFTVGEDPYNPIDVLIDILDELDDRMSELGDGHVLPDHHMASIRSVLSSEWSSVALALNELIRMSMSDINNESCDFVRKLVGRIDLENLPSKTKELYIEAFLPNYR